MTAAPDLLERERELTTLDALLAAATRCEGGVAVVEGPAGIGKSRLLAAARERAAAGDRFTVLAARCGELERDFSFGAVRQLLEPALRDGAALTGAAAPAAGVLGASPDEAPAEGSFAVLHGLYWATLELAERRPLLLAVDDIQWADPPTLRFLAYLARRLEGVPVLLAATLRSAEPGADPGLLDELADDPLCTSIRPAPLGPDGVAALVRARLGDDADRAFCTACHDATGGNPLLLRQLLAALEQDGVRPRAAQAPLVREVGPRAVGRSVLRRLSRLGGGAVEVARAVAVLGESARMATVAGLTGLDEAGVARTVGDLARADVLAADPPLGFAHPLVREAVYRDPPAAERQLLHARAAEALRAAGAEEEEVAAQLLHAPQRGEPATVALLRATAARASRRGGPEGAIALLRRALEEPPAPELRPQVLFELGMAQADVSAPDCAATLREAYDLLGDPRQRAGAALALAAALLFTGGAREGSALCRRTAAELGDEHADERAALEAIVLLAVAFDADDHALDPLWRRALEEEPPPAEGRVGATLYAAACAWVRAAAGMPAAETERTALRALEDDVLLHSRNGLFWSAAMVTLTLCESEHSARWLERTRVDVYRHGGTFTTASVEMWTGFDLLLRGELADAGAMLDQAVRLQEPWGSDEIGSMWSRGLLATQSLLAGADGATVRATLGPAPPADEHTDGANLWRAARAELALAEGAPAEAHALAREMGAGSPRIVHPAWKPWRSLAARALADLGRREEALVAIAEEIAVADRIGTPALRARCRRVRGEIEGGEAGLALLEEAVALLDGSPARLERARSLAALGAALRRHGRVSDAREPLRAALELADACGCPPLAERARAELYAAGARPRTAALGGVAALTASEARVAALAAEGRTNREIAQALFVTPKTVEVHLSNAYRKLDIRSRRELPGALAGSAA